MGWCMVGRINWIWSAYGKGFVLCIRVYVDTMDDTKIQVWSVDEFGMENIDTTFVVEYGYYGAGDIVVTEIVKKSEDGKSGRPKESFLTFGHRTFGLKKQYICKLFENRDMQLTNRAKLVDRRPMTAVEKIYLWNILKGMIITFKHIFKRKATIQ